MYQGTDSWESFFSLWLPLADYLPSTSLTDPAARDVAASTRAKVRALALATGLGHLKRLARAPGLWVSARDLASSDLMCWLRIETLGGGEGEALGTCRAREREEERGRGADVCCRGRGGTYKDEIRSWISLRVLALRYVGVLRSGMGHGGEGRGGTGGRKEGGAGEGRKEERDKEGEGVWLSHGQRRAEERQGSQEQMVGRDGGEGGGGGEGERETLAWTVRAEAAAVWAVWWGRGGSEGVRGIGMGRGREELGEGRLEFVCVYARARVCVCVRARACMRVCVCMRACMHACVRGSGSRCLRRRRCECGWRKMSERELDPLSLSRIYSHIHTPLHIGDRSSICTTCPLSPQGFMEGGRS
jgi:hypothetical protein